jgi:hypothetical protein
MASGGQIIGKPGGIVEPGIEYYGKYKKQNLKSKPGTLEYNKEYYAANKELTDAAKLVEKRKEKILNFLKNKKEIRSTELSKKLADLGYKSPPHALNDLKNKKWFKDLNIKFIQDPNPMLTGDLRRGAVDLSKGQLTVANKYAKYLNSFDKDSKYYVSADDWKNLATKDRQKITNIMRNNEGTFVKNFSRQLRFSTANEKKLMDAFGLTAEDFKEHGRFGVPRNHPEYNHIFRFTEKGFKFTTVDLLNSKTRNNVMANFELPEGVKKWDFDRYRYGLPGTAKENRNLGKRISDFVSEKKPFEIASDWSTAKGWGMGSMHRVYKNQTEIVDGVRVPKKGVKLTYEPLYDKVNGKKIIVGFKDNTPSGGGKPYYGLKKYHNKFNGTDWTNHKDYSRIVKFVDIAKRTNNAPNEVIQSLLKGKGIDPNIRLNDILSYDRYYGKLSTTTPKALLESQIVKHHMGGVGSKDLARAAATKDIQLLTGAANQTARDLEIKLSKNKFLSAADNQTLKNIGATIKGSTGQVYGGGYINPEKQFTAIEKQALDIVKGERFNLKGFETYLKALCPKGKASGGRIGYATGTPTVACGRNQLQKLLFQGGGTTAERNLVQRIISGGGKMAMGMLNPKELLRISNLVGPAALGIMAAYEAGSITDDVLRLNKPLNEALAGNWLTKAFTPFSEEFAKQKNLLQSGQLTGNQKEYALEMMKMEEFMKAGKVIEGMEATQLLDGSGYGNIDGSPMVSNETLNKGYKDLFGRFSRLKPYAYEDGITGRSLENEAAMNEYEDAQTARTGASKIFGGPQRLVNRAPRPTNMGRGPMTEKARMKLDYHIPGYTPYDKAYTPSDEEILQIYRSQGIVPPTSGYLAPGEGTRVRIGLASQGDNRSIYGSKFSEGGITGLRSKYEYKK